MTVIDLGYRPRHFQADVHRRRKRFTVAVAHRRFGKTYCAIMQLIDAACRDQRKDARYGYLAPFLRQSKSVAWDYMKAIALKIPGAEKNEQELSIDLPHGPRLRLFGGDNADALRGMYFDGIVIDEMADLKAEVWGAIIRPSLADRKGWAFFIGTPRGINQFSEIYDYACSGQDPEWIGLLYRADETGVIDASELAAARRAMSDAQYRQEFLCDFSAASDSALITIDQVSDAAKRQIPERDIMYAPKIIGVDVARYGDDRSVIQKRQGLVAFDPKIMSGLDNMALADQVAWAVVDWEPDAVFIDAGRGEGVIDRLRQLGHSVVEVNFGGKAADEHYANKRVEMWDTMAKWIKSGGSLPNIPELKSELCVPTYDFDNAGRMRLESKDDIKARGLRSPDIADALALTFASPVAAASVTASTSVARGRYQSEYDPMASMNGAVEKSNGPRKRDPWMPHQEKR